MIDRLKQIGIDYKDVYLTENILSNYFSTDLERYPEAPGINTTDDIGESEPYQNLLNCITNDGSEVDPRLRIELPFQQYRKFDDEQDSHRFTMHSTYSSRHNMEVNLEEYTDLFEVLSAFHSSTTFSIYDDQDMTVENKVDQIIGTLKKYEADFPDSDFIGISGLRSKLHEYIEFIREREEVEEEQSREGVRRVSPGTYSDWYLPSLDELLEINAVLFDIGNFEEVHYWTSTEVSNQSAYTVYFGMDMTYSSISYKNEYPGYSIRPIRDFTAPPGAYNIRDIGPAGGWIFYMEDLEDGLYKYYECGPKDIETEYAAWGATSYIVGTNGKTQIGMGKSNTSKIVNTLATTYSPHAGELYETNRAAQICDQTGYTTQEQSIDSTDTSIIPMMLSYGDRNSHQDIQIRGVCIHDTQNYNKGAGAKWHGRYLSSKGAIDRGISWHFAVDSDHIVQSVEIGKRANHGANSAHPLTLANQINNHFVGIEICINSDSSLNEATEKTAKLTANILRKAGLPVNSDTVIPHSPRRSPISGTIVPVSSSKICPYEILVNNNPYNFTKFINRVKFYYNKIQPDALEFTFHRAPVGKESPEYEIAERMRNEIADIINPIGHYIFRREFKNIARTLLYEIDGKIENLSIHSKPGTSVPLLIEGEDDPIIQSTGGRTCNVTVTFKESSLKNLAKIALLFNVEGAANRMYSMLTMARSTFKGDYDSTTRFRLMYDVIQDEIFDRHIEQLSGRRELYLDRPIYIRNEILNSLGMPTFLAKSLEVTTSPQHAGVFDVTIGLVYVNLSYRAIDTVRKHKRDSFKPVMPAAIAMDIDDSKKDKSTEKLKLISSMAQMSLNYGLPDLLAIYSLYRINEFRKVLEMTAPGEEGSPHLNVSSDSLGQYISSLSVEDVQRLEDMLGAASISTTKYKASTSQMWATAHSITTSLSSALIGEALIDGAYDRVGARRVGETRTPIVDPSGRGPGIWQRLSGASRAGKVTKRAIHGSVAVTGIGTTLTSYVGRRNFTDIEGADSMMYFLPYMSSIFLMDFIREYIEAAKDKDIEGFINKIAHSALDVYRYFTVEEDTEQLTYLFKDPITLETDNGTFDIRRIAISNRLGTVHRDNESFIKALDSGQKQLERRAKRSLNSIKEHIESSSTPTADKILALPGICAISLSMQAMSTSHILGTNSSKLTVPALRSLQSTANDLFLSRTAVNHAKDIIASLITSSGLVDCANAMFFYSDTPTATQEAQNISTTINERDRQAIKITNRGLTDSIVNGRREATRYGIDEKTICRPIVGTYSISDIVDQGYLDTLLYCLHNVTLLWSADEVPLVEDYYQSIGVRQKDIVNIVQVINELYPSKYKVVLEVMKMTAQFIVAVFTSYVVYKLFAVATKLLASALVAIGAAGILILLGKILALVALIIFIVSVLYYVLRDFIFKSIQLISSYTNIFALSKHISDRMSDMITADEFIQICLKSDIWLIDLTEAVDATDLTSDKTTAYLDYPIVRITTDDREISCMPDFYIAKTDFIADTIKEITENFESIIATTKEYTEELGDFDHNTLLERYRRQLDRTVIGKTKITEDLKMRLQVLLPDINHLSPIATERLFNKLNKAFSSDLFYVQINGQHLSGNRESDFLFRIDLNSQGGEYASVVNTPVINKERERILIGENSELALRMRDPETTIIEHLLNIDEGLDSKTITAVQGFAYSLIRILQDYAAYVKLNQSSIHEHVLQEGAPRTLGHVMLLRELIGTSMNAVGKQGLAMLRNQLNEISTDTVHKIAAFRSGHLLPALKLFFIEEDNEAFYLFDDLYSFASIISAKVHKDKHSPIQTCILEIADIHGTLSNVMADAVNREFDFFTGRPENTQLNALMLKPGTKIKLQAGTNPHLTEENTIFVGQITSVTPGVITKIEAQSYGRVLMEEISVNKVRTYPSELERGFLKTTWQKLKQLGTSLSNIFFAILPFGISLGSYQNSLYQIKDIISYVLGDIRRATKTLSNYTINPAEEVSIEGRLEHHTTEAVEALKQSAIPDIASDIAQQTGLDVKVDINDQLFENVRIMGDINKRRWTAHVPTATGRWSSFGETGWDIIESLNLLLPNNITTVRPYGERGTFIWGSPDDYYRYRRGATLDSIVATSLAEKIRTIIYSNRTKSREALDYIVEAIGSQDDNTRASALALLCIICYDSQVLTNQYFEGNVPEELLISLDDSQEEMLVKAFSWIYNISGGGIGMPPPLRNWRIQQNLRRTVRSNVFKYIPRTVEAANICLAFISEGKTGHMREEGDFSGIFIRDIQKEMTRRGYDTGAQEANIIGCLSFDYACEEVLSYVYNMACSMSKSHKKISATHIKQSGRDILSNSITLQEPYNAVLVTEPQDSDMAGEDLFREIGQGRKGEVPIPIHWQLKYWNQKVYSAYYPNMHVFPTMLSGTRSIVSASILTNLIKDTYDGYITFLADESINEGDKVLIVDELNDMIGFVEAESVTYSISAHEGALTTIKPKMVSRNDHALTNTVRSTITWAADRVLGIIFTAAVIALLFKGARTGRSIAAQLSVRKEAARAAGPLTNYTEVFKTNLTGSIVSSGITLANWATSSVINRLLSLGPSQAAMKEAVKVNATFRKLRTPESVDNITDFITKTITPPNVTLPSEVSLTGRQDIMGFIGRGYAQIQKNLFKEMDPNNLSQFNRAARDILNKEVTEKIVGTWTDQRIAQVAKVLQERGLFTTVDSAKTHLTTARTQIQTHITEAIATSFPSNYNIGQAEFSAARTAVREAARNATEVQRNPELFTHIYKNAIFGKVDYIAHFRGGLTTTFTAHFASNLLFSAYMGSIDAMLDSGLIPDNVTISPLFHKGEPYVANLHGMTKGDGERVGMWNILKQRFGDMGEGMWFGATDPIKMSLYRAYNEINRGDYDQ